MKSLLFKLLMAITRLFVGKGLGRLDLLRKAFALFTKSTMPTEAKVIDVKLFKMQINTDKRGLDGMTAVLSAKHEYEPVTTKAFEYILKPGMSVVDIGANIGYFTLLSSQLVGENGIVWAVEPEPFNFQCLLDNIRLNGFENILPMPFAISDEDGEAMLYVSDAESGEHSLVTGRPHIKNQIAVETIRLDNLLNGNRVDLIKTDTEGNEVAVVEGAIATLENLNIKLITEFWTPGINAAGHSPLGYWQLLRRLGFNHIYILDEIGGGILDGTYGRVIECCNKGKYSVNLLCSREELDILR